MRCFLDTECTDDGEHFELISIAIVGDDGREYYAAVEGYDPSAVTPWIPQHVLPQLPAPGDNLWKLRTQIRDDIAGFVTGSQVEFWTMCAWVDWSLVVRLFGRFEDVPANWPMACWDLWQYEAALGLSREQRLPEPEGVHNALIDARYHRAIYHDLSRRECRFRTSTGVAPGMHDGTEFDPTAANGKPGALAYLSAFSERVEGWRAPGAPDERSLPTW